MRKTTRFLGIIALVVCITISAIFFINIILFPLKYENEIISFSKKYGVNSGLIASIINTESGFRDNAISHKGAIGLMQIMPSTGEWIAKKIGIEEFSDEMLKDYKINIEIGTCYFKYLLDKFRNEETALAAYNAGEGVVNKWLKNEQYSIDKLTLKQIPYKETDRYVKRVKNQLFYYSRRLS